MLISGGMMLVKIPFCIKWVDVKFQKTT